MKTNFKCSLILIILLGIGACSNDDDNQVPALPDLPSVSIGQHTSHGSILVTNEGFSLYVFAFDVDGEAACNDGCAAAWPPYYDQNLTLGEGLDGLFMNSPMMPPPELSTEMELVVFGT